MSLVRLGKACTDCGQGELKGGRNWVQHRIANWISGYQSKLKKVMDPLQPQLSVPDLPGRYTYLGNVRIKLHILKCQNGFSPFSNSPWERGSWIDRKM